MAGKKKYVRKSITIRKDQDEFLKAHFVNLSRFVQKKLDEMKGVRGNE